MHLPERNNAFAGPTCVHSLQYHGEQLLDKITSACNASVVKLCGYLHRNQVLRHALSICRSQLRLDYDQRRSYIQHKSYITRAICTHPLPPAASRARTVLSHEATPRAQADRAGDSRPVRPHGAELVLSSARMLALGLRVRRELWRDETCRRSSRDGGLPSAVLRHRPRLTATHAGHQGH